MAAMSVITITIITEIAVTRKRLYISLLLLNYLLIPLAFLVSKNMEKYKVPSDKKILNVCVEKSILKKKFF